MSILDCNMISAECPVSIAFYGYHPDLIDNGMLLGVFAICSIAQLALGIWKRLPAFGSVVSIGCILETVGYAGRIGMSQNPWSDLGFKIQMVCLVVAPSFLAAGFYLTLKHVVSMFGPQHSRLRPALYTLVFITADCLGIILQSVGGGIAASPGGSIVATGSSIIVAGIAFQVATMGLCILLALDFAWTLYRANGSHGRRTSQLIRVGTCASPRRFYFYLACTLSAFLTIFVRSIYRLPEMSGGWGGPLMRREGEFLALDGAMIAIAAVLLTIAHPGIFFPEMLTKSSNALRAEIHSSDSTEALEVTKISELFDKKEDSCSV